MTLYLYFSYYQIDMISNETLLKELCEFLWNEYENKIHEIIDIQQESIENVEICTHLLQPGKKFRSKPRLYFSTRIP